jgi:predicted transcriptional regulator
MASQTQLLEVLPDAPSHALNLSEIASAVGDTNTTNYGRQLGKLMRCGLVAFFEDGAPGRKKRYWWRL